MSVENLVEMPEESDEEVVKPVSPKKEKKEKKEKAPTVVMIDSRAINSRVKFRTEPRSDSDHLYSVNPGTMFELLEITGRWAKVVSPTGEQGYILSGYLVRITDDGKHIKLG